MTVAILLVACALLAGAMLGLGVALSRLRERVRALETLPVTPAGSLRDASSLGSSGQVVTGASAPSSTSGPLVEEVAQRPSRDRDEHEEYVITRLGDESATEAVTPLEGRLFADIVLRESVVKAASFVYGVRRGLSPANRNRIWFEMRREVKRARKDRKAEEREAIRDWRARQRAADGGRHAQREDDAA